MAGQDRSWVDAGMGDKRRFVALSGLEFADKDAPTIRITFTRDGSG